MMNQRRNEKRHDCIAGLALRKQFNVESRKMCFFFSLLPATFWAVIGYFVLFSSVKADGRIKGFGQALAIWVFVIAGCILLAGAYITIAGLCSIDAAMACFK